jgi:hypothetical protein
MQQAPALQSRAAELLAPANDQQLQAVQVLAPSAAHLQRVAVEGEDLEADEPSKDAEHKDKGAIEQQVPGPHHEVVHRVAQALRMVGRNGQDEAKRQKAGR